MTCLLNTRNSRIALSLLISAPCAGALANPIDIAIDEATPIVELRLRYESVDQRGLSEEASALVIRGRLGFETATAWGTSFLVEGDFLGALIDDYREDPSVAIKANFPVVADPEGSEVNRLQLRNTSIPNTVVTLGRQRLVLDDQRFVASLDWRNNDQTYDALRVTNRPAGGKLLIDVTYANRVNRIFGSNSPQGTYEGDLVFSNLSYQFRLGKLTVFNYSLDFDPLLQSNFPGLTAAQAASFNPVRRSTNTVGARFSGDAPLAKITLGYALSYAKQNDYGDNPLSLNNEYFLGEVSTTVNQYSLILGNEILQGNGRIGFSTPLGLLHGFQGWTDKWLATPANGIDDRYVRLSAVHTRVGPLETLNTVVAYHTYESERLSINYGSELNVSLAAKAGRFSVLLKYADYKAYESTPIAEARDTRKAWVQLDFVW